MKQRIALAYSGTLASSAAVAWLLERHGADVVTVTVDVGQSDDLDDVRSRALACGALRAHVIDARDRFARDHAIPALRAGAAAPLPLASLAAPLIANTLVEIGSIEMADALAHAAGGEPGAALSAQLSACDPSVRVLAPADEWRMDDARLAAYARERGLPGGVDRQDANLLIRRAVDPARAPAVAAHLDIAFAAAVPVALNGVPMPPADLLESLSLIGGQYGLGHGELTPAPAAAILRAAYRVATSGNDSVRVTLERASDHVTAVRNPDAQLVNHP